MAWGRHSTNKYGAKREEIAGRSFASGLEKAVYLYLLALEQGGEISDIRCQVRVLLTEAKILFIPDFSVFDKALGETVHVEAKGLESDVYRIKRRLWMHYGPGLLRVYKGSKTKFKLFEEIRPNANNLVQEVRREDTAE